MKTKSICCTRLGCFGSLLISLSAAAAVVSIDPAVRHQVFEGFGEGTMDQFTPYYYREYPAASRTDYLDKLFKLDNHGLGLTICRVLMPVGDAPGHAHMNRFYGQNNQCPPSFEPEDGVYDWSNPRHEEILWKIRGAAARGAKMCAQWYSYPYWMTVSGCTAGHTDGNQNNLRTDMEGRFIEHVCKVLEHFRDSWNVDFEYLNVINEPEANWWVYWGGQPGARVTEDQAIRIYQKLNARLPLYNLSPDLVAYDAAWTNTTAYLNTLLNSSIVDDLDVLSCHQYTTSESGLFDWKIQAVLNQKSLWQTEWGDWTNAQYPGYTPGGNADTQMMNYAHKIHEALSVLKAGAWVMWEPEFIFNSQTKTFQPRKAYWAIAQYSRHVRPGMQMIHVVSSHPDIKTTAWHKQSQAAEQELVLVTVNSAASAIMVDYDLSAFHLARIDQIFRTSSTQNYEVLNVSQPSSSGIFTISMPAESITTIVLRFQNCTPLNADLIDDCIVDIQDLECLAKTWLMNDSFRTIPEFADVNDDRMVNMEDATVFSTQWQDFKAFAPIPANRAGSVNPASQMLGWSANPHAVAHQVYLGTDMASVASACQDDAEYMGQVDGLLFVPNLLPNQTYYWRIDEVNDSGMVCKGMVWEFMTVEFSSNPDLIGHWTMDETSGSIAADQSFYGHDGMLTGNPEWKPAQGRIAGAIELDGSGDAIEIPDFDWTIEYGTFTAWVNCYEVVPWAGIVYSRNGTACGIHYENINNLRYTWNNNNPKTWNWNSGLVIPDNEWVFLAVVIQPDSARL
ncbi:MAG: hypothetical protein JXB18_15385, partial [Sedimentisphaerales bacterium]|nr:hypothetical protein [Sedimentisphaerales bacterium]